MYSTQLTLSSSLSPFTEVFGRPCLSVGFGDAKVCCLQEHILKDWHPVMAMAPGCNSTHSPEGLSSLWFPCFLSFRLLGTELV